MGNTSLNPLEFPNTYNHWPMLFGTLIWFGTLHLIIYKIYVIYKIICLCSTFRLNAASVTKNGNFVGPDVKNQNEIYAIFSPFHENLIKTNDYLLRPKSTVPLWLAEVVSTVMIYISTQTILTESLTELSIKVLC